jgi:hypothetical protein
MTQRLAVLSARYELTSVKPEPLGKLCRAGLYPGAACFLTLRPHQRGDKQSEVLEVRAKAAPLPWLAQPRILLAPGF